ncbi:thioredoxin [Pelomonas sp. KK5]|uniref:thioredoxin n=1 Tax=Pelomonas sp. KK5 TaxID=1855730 RepID=UPI00097BD2DB|nr:thioredoxin [Pelomonas sp. KK5]
MTTNSTAPTVADLNEADFTAEVEHSPIPVFIDFHASWCGPCKALAPIFTDLARTYAGQVKFLKVDADDNKNLTRRLGVRGLPTLMLFKDGVAVERVVGSHHKAFFGELLNRHAAQPVNEPGAQGRSFSAFHGDAAVRDRVVAQVSRQEALEEDLGIPEAVGRIQEAVHALLIEHGEARSTPARGQRPLEWWRAIPPGADLQRLPSRFTHLFLLDLLHHGAHTGGELSEDAHATVAAVAVLHLRAAEDVASPASADWERARAAATTLHQALGDEAAHQHARHLLDLAGRLAWPVQVLDGAVVDAIHGQLHAEVAMAVRNTYTDEAWAQSLELLKTIEATFRKAYEDRYGNGPTPPRQDIEAMAEYQSGQALFEPHRRIREAELNRVRPIFGERMHALLMRALAQTTGMPG